MPIFEIKTNLSRRGVIDQLAALILTLVFGANAVRAAEATSTPADQLGWQMAIHARTFKDYSLFETMDKTVALGLKYMSLSAGVNLESTNSISVLKLSDAQIQSIKDHAAAKGIKFVNVYVPLPGDEKECRKSFEFARKMGLDTLVGEPEPEALDTVEKLCKEYNIRVAIHDHPKPSKYWNPQFVLDAIKGRSPLLGACADTGHWQRSGLDPVECLKTLQGHIFTLHFKDLNEKKKQAHDVPWGSGVGHCKEMMAELKRQGFKGAYCVEYEYHYGTSTPEIAECVKFFNQTCAELAATKSQHEK